MTSGRLEILVEPFKEDDPGPHVMAVLEILQARGFTVDMGPFSTTAIGELSDLISIVEILATAGFKAGATSMRTTLEKL